MEDQMKQFIEGIRMSYLTTGVDITCETPIYEEKMVPMRDGVKLYAYCYLPEGEGPFPVIQQRSCYAEMDFINKPTGEELAKRGYAYICQHCRGTGKSEGHWEPIVNEREDGLDTLDWITAQPWSGNIGIYGSSYLALVGWIVADAVPEQVKSMYLSNYGVDRYTSAYKDGLMRHDILTSWAMDNAGFPVTADYMESCRYRPHNEVDEKLWGRRLPWYQDWLSNPYRTCDFWQQGIWKKLSEIPRDIRIPLYISDSWYDHHLGSALFSYDRLPDEIKAHTTLEIGSWNHLMQLCLQDKPTANAMTNMTKTMVQWFEATLKREEKPEAAIHTYEIGADKWNTWECWPVKEEKTETLYFAPADKDGCRQLTETPVDGTAGFVYDPEEPVPSHGAESMLHTMAEVGSMLQPEPDWRDDVLSFISEPLERDTHILGQMKAKLFVSSDAEDTAFTAKIMEVNEEGKAYNIRSTITTLCSAQDMTYTPGEVREVALDMWDIDWQLKKGSRIRVDISSSDFPQYAVHSNFAGPWAEQAVTKKAKQTIYMGAEYPSALAIPVYEEV